jgi:hypothetical protein
VEGLLARSFGPGVVFDVHGIFVHSFGSLGSGDGEFRYPADVAVSGESVYVVDYGNQRSFGT